MLEDLYLTKLPQNLRGGVDEADWEGMGSLGTDGVLQCCVVFVLLIEQSVPFIRRVIDT